MYPPITSFDIMDTNRPIELVHGVQKQLDPAPFAGHVTGWISVLHPEKLECRLEGNFLHGSYNLGQKLRFSDGSAWLLLMR